LVRKKMGTDCSESMDVSLAALATEMPIVFRPCIRRPVVVLPCKGRPGARQAGTRVRVLERTELPHQHQHHQRAGAGRPWHDDMQNPRVMPWIFPYHSFAVARGHLLRLAARHEDRAWAPHSCEVCTRGSYAPLSVRLLPPPPHHLAGFDSYFRDRIGRGGRVCCHSVNLSTDMDTWRWCNARIGRHEALDCDQNPMRAFFELSNHACPWLDGPPGPLGPGGCERTFALLVQKSPCQQKRFSISPSGSIWNLANNISK
jgi:hypothetical protein